VGALCYGVSIALSITAAHQVGAIRAQAAFAAAPFVGTALSWAALHDDGHHGHVDPDLPAGVRHTHWHQHPRMEHAHPHVADLHHRHGLR